MKKKSVFTIATAGVLAVAVLVTTIGGNSVVLQAAGQLPGVEKIVEEKVTNGDPFRILEIVPTDADGKKGTGDIGFLVDGEQEEYINSVMQEAGFNVATGTEARKKIIESALQKLKDESILEWDDNNDNTHPLYAHNTNFYEESYELIDNTGWNVLHLDTAETVILKGKYEYVGPGQGQYTVLVDHFEYVSENNGFYSLTFVPFTGTADEVALGQKYGFYSLDDTTHNYIFETKNQEELDKEADSNLDTDTGSDVDSDAEVIYYIISNAEYVPEGGQLYGGVGESYVYGENGIGEYVFVQDDTCEEQEVKYTKVFYKINLISNDWFNTKVLGEEVSDSNDGLVVPELITEVDTYTVQEVIDKNLLIDSYDMFYLSGDFFNGAGMTYNITNAEVLADANVALLGIFTSLAEKNTPCIIDRDIFVELQKPANQNDANYQKIDVNPIYKWVLMAMNKTNPQDVFKSYVDGADLDWIELWNNIDDTTTTYVTHNIYILDEILSKANLEEAFTGSKLDGFKEISELIEAINFTAEEDDKLSTDISVAVAIQYIINYQITGSITNKTEIKVLEIQPCYDFNYMITDREQQDNNQTAINQKQQNIADLLGGALGATKFTYQRETRQEVTVGNNEKVINDEFGSCTYLTDNSKTVSVYGMTTAEFIGKIEDLNTQYDMIYIGMNIGLMNTKNYQGEVITDYNDDAMDGFVYTHTGDAILCRNELSGLLYTDYVDSNSPYTSLVYDMTAGLDMSVSADVKDRWLHYYYTENDEGVMVPDIKKHDVSVNYAEGYRDSSGEFQTTNVVTTPQKVGNVNVYRFSGNDITEEKMEHVLDFIKAKYPVVLADDFVYSTDTGAALKVNSMKIDNTSWMYRLIDKCWGQDNVFLTKEVQKDANGIQGAEAANFARYINVAKLSLTVDADNEVESNEARQLSYSFSVNSTINSGYDKPYYLYLYVDMNRDGRYGASEIVEGLTLTDGSGKAVVETDGKYVIYADQTYSLVRALSDDSVGAIPWKLEVVQAENEYLRASEEGTLVIKKRNGTETQVINILQIAQKSGQTDYRVGNWNLQEELEKPAYQQSYFRDFVKDPTVSNTFTINVTTMESDEYTRQYNAAATADEPRNILDDYNMLIIGFADVYQDIDNEIVSGNKLGMGSMDAVLKFIGDGKSVLFTHDTTSYNNVPTVDNRYYSPSQPSYRNTTDWMGNPSVWNAAFTNTQAYYLYEKTTGNNQSEIFGTRFTGYVSRHMNSGQNFNGYLFNTLLRNLVGMDRYGVTNHDETDSLMQLLKQGDVQKVKASSIEGDTSYTYIDKDNEEIELVSTNKDVAYAAGTWNGKDTAYTYAETHGYNNNLLNQQHKELTEIYSGVDNQFYSLSSTKSDIVEYGTNNYDNGAFREGAGYTMYARKTNEGQITSYPYVLGDKIEVSETHYQWYQLDMEADDDNDGNSDIVVWYTLCDVESGNSAVDNFYTASPNDARNNYYIYSKGNVMYSGVGHSTVKKASEVQLFINTMIAAYQTAAKDPAVKILNGPEADSGEKKSEYLFFDDYVAKEDTNNDGIDDGLVDKDLEMYFVMEESNLVTEGTTTTVQFKLGSEWITDNTTIDGKEPLKLQLYPAEQEGNIGIMPDDGVATDTNEDGTVTSTKGVWTYSIEPGTVYKLVIPNYYARVAKGQQEVITVKVDSKFNYYGSYVEKEARTSMNVLRAGLFNLN